MGKEFLSALSRERKGEPSFMTWDNFRWSWFNDHTKLQLAKVFYLWIEDVQVKWVQNCISIECSENDSLKQPKDEIKCIRLRREAKSNHFESCSHCFRRWGLEILLLLIVRLLVLSAHGHCHHCCWAFILTTVFFLVYYAPVTISICQEPEF